MFHCIPIPNCDSVALTAAAEYADDVIKTPGTVSGSVRFGISANCVVGENCTSPNFVSSAGRGLFSITYNGKPAACICALANRPPEPRILHARQHGQCARRRSFPPLRATRIILHVVKTLYAQVFRRYRCTFYQPDSRQTVQTFDTPRQTARTFT